MTAADYGCALTAAGILWDTYAEEGLDTVYRLAGVEVARVVTGSLLPVEP